MNSENNKIVTVIIERIDSRIDRLEELIDRKLDQQTAIYKNHDTRLDEVEKKIVEHDAVEKERMRIGKNTLIKWGFVLGVLGPVIASVITFILLQLV